MGIAEFDVYSPSIYSVELNISHKVPPLGSQDITAAVGKPVTLTSNTIQSEYKLFLKKSPIFTINDNR
jgi:hypothetical protein